MGKKVSIYIWVIVIFVVLAISLIVGSFFLGQATKGDVRVDINKFSKWGVTFDYSKQLEKQNFQISHKEIDNMIEVKTKGTFYCPKPGEKYFIDFCDANGFNEKALSLDNSSVINFTIGSFMDKNTFDCPLIFHAGRDENGNPVIINGSDYIGKKYELEKMINEAANKLDIQYIKENSDMHNIINSINSEFYVEFPKDKAELFDSINNASYDFEITSVLSEVSSK